MQNWEKTIDVRLFLSPGTQPRESSCRIERTRGWVSSALQISWRHCIALTRCENVEGRTRQINCLFRRTMRITTLNAASRSKQHCLSTSHYRKIYCLTWNLRKRLEQRLLDSCKCQRLQIWTFILEKVKRTPIPPAGCPMTTDRPEMQRKTTSCLLTDHGNDRSFWAASFLLQ